MRKYEGVTTVRIPKETEADMAYLDKNKIDVPEVCRQAIIKAIQEWMKKIKKIS